MLPRMNVRVDSSASRNAKYRRSRATVKAFDMVLRYRNNFNRIHRLSNVLIPPLAEWPGNNYLGLTPQTTD
jgi:hypothetical protein